MADQTSYEDELPRNEAATRLQALARQLEGEGPAKVEVGNKTVTLAPASTVEYEVQIRERSPMLGGRREEIELTIEWAVDEGEG